MGSLELHAGTALFGWDRRAYGLGDESGPAAPSASASVPALQRPHAPPPGVVAAALDPAGGGAPWAPIRRGAPPRRGDFTAALGRPPVPTPRAELLARRAALGARA